MSTPTIAPSQPSQALVLPLQPPTHLQKIIGVIVTNTFGVVAKLFVIMVGASKERVYITREQMKKFANGPKAAKTFPQFNTLPIELRRKIWNQAASVSRIVEIKVKIDYSQYSHHARGLRFSSKTPVPGLLHVNAESREIGLKYWKLSMGSHRTEARIYMNFRKDIVYFGDVNLSTFEWSLSTLIRDVPESELAKIRHLAVTQELWNYRSECNIHVLPDFANLKRVTLVKERRALDKTRPLMFVTPRDSDHYISEIPGTDFGQLLWPGEFHEIVEMFLEDAYEEQFDRMPTIEFRVLAQQPQTWKQHFNRLNGKLGLLATK